MSSMLHRFLHALALLSFALALTHPAGVHAGDEPMRVVFVGNSYTYANDLPMLYRALARSQHPDRDIETDAFVTPGGYLSERWREGAVQKFLKTNRVDVLVLQEAGGWLRCADHPSLRTAFACTDSLRTHKRYAEFAAKLGVRTVILGTWGADVREQATISRVTRRLSKAIDALPADAGEAILELRKIDDSIPLFTDRALHPTPDASMLAAVMLYAAIDGWLPEARAIRLEQPLISVTAKPAATVPLSLQYSTLPRETFKGFSAERMALLRQAAKAVLEQH
jgi:hypothetical protein